MSFISKRFVSLFLALFSALIAPSLLAHEGHGGSSLVQHALEHGYMLLVPIFVVAIVAWTVRGRRKQIKSRID